MINGGTLCVYVGGQGPSIANAPLMSFLSGAWGQDLGCSIPGMFGGEVGVSHAAAIHRCANHKPLSGMWPQRYNTG